MSNTKSYSSEKKKPKWDIELEIVDTTAAPVLYIVGQ